MCRIRESEKPGDGGILTPFISKGKGAGERVCGCVESGLTFGIVRGGDHDP